MHMQLRQMLLYIDFWCTCIVLLYAFVMFPGFIWIYDLVNSMIVVCAIDSSGRLQHRNNFVIVTSDYINGGCWQWYRALTL